MEIFFIYFGGKCLLISNPDEKAYMSEVTSLAAPTLAPQMDHTITYAVITCNYDTLVTQEQRISMFQFISTNGPHNLPLFISVATYITHK